MKGCTMKTTRKDYENYLNNFDCRELNLSTDNFVRKPGTWLRRNDPIAFNVGYDDFVRENER